MNEVCDVVKQAIYSHPRRPLKENEIQLISGRMVAGENGKGDLAGHGSFVCFKATIAAFLNVLPQSCQN